MSLDFDHTYPEVGYQTVEWDILKPPEEQLMALTHANRLKLSEMSPRPDRELTQYSLFDSEENDYTQRNFDTLPESPDPERLDEVLQRIETADGKPLRLAFVELAGLAAAHSDESIPAAEPHVCALGRCHPCHPREGAWVPHEYRRHRS